MNGESMKAAVLFELNKPLEVVELPVRKPKAGQVLVKMAYTAICHTQLLEIQGKNASGPMNPNMLGHEGSGIVEEVGEGVKKVKKGDHVILSWIKGIGENVLPDKYEHDGKEINCGFVTTFNEYALASENRVTPIPKDMPLKEASIIGCAVSTGMGAVLNNAEVEKGKSVLVIGIGGIGVNMLQASKIRGANPIIAVDINDEKLKSAKKFGATHIINSKNLSMKELEEKILEVAGENGADYAFETVGRKEIMELLYEITNKFSGKAVLCGVPNPLGLKIEIDPFPLYYGRRMTGTGGGESEPDKDFKKYCEMFMKGKIDLTGMITHVVSLEDINKGIDLIKQGKCCRTVIEF